MKYFQKVYFFKILNIKHSDYTIEKIEVGILTEFIMTSSKLEFLPPAVMSNNEIPIICNLICDYYSMDVDNCFRMKKRVRMSF